jgi:chorismate mutase
MTFPLVRAIRGAINCPEDSVEEIDIATKELLAAMLEANEASTEDVISVLFTTTPDLTSAFPASAARGVGFSGVPLMCASEIAVPGAMPLTVRVMMHVHSTKRRDEIRHVYLRDTPNLRLDLD